MAAATPPPAPEVYQPTNFQRTLLALRERLQDYDTDRAGDRLGSAVLRGAAAGLALRGGLHAASYAFGLLLRGRRRAAAPRPTLAQVLEDTLRYGAFLGGFAGVFVAADELIALLGGKKRTSAWRALVSGALAGPTILLTGSQETHTSLSLYVFLRSLALLIRCGNLPTAAPWKRRLLAPTRWRHGDVALMCLSTAQIGYSWIILPQTLPPAYIRFLNKHGGKSLPVYDGLRELSARAAAGAAPARLAALRGTRHERFCGPRPCGFLHPGRSCAGHAARFLPGAYLRALPVYFPVYLIPAALVHRQRLLQRPTAAELWPKLGLGVARSALFLSLFCTLAWAGACSGFNAAGTSTGRVIALSCWTGGLATLAEKKSRRMELAFYCMSRALESFALCLAAWGVVPPGVVPRRVDALLFSAATAAICHCYSDHYGARRDVFRSKYLAVFDFVLGSTGFKSASIRHNPSNLELLLALEQNLEGRRALAVPLHLVRSVAALSGYGANGRATPTLPITPVQSMPVLRDAAEGGPACDGPETHAAAND